MLRRRSRQLGSPEPILRTQTIPGAGHESVPEQRPGSVGRRALAPHQCELSRPRRFAAIPASPLGPDRLSVRAVLDHEAAFPALPAAPHPLDEVARRGRRESGAAAAAHDDRERRLSHTHTHTQTRARAYPRCGAVYATTVALQPGALARPSTAVAPLRGQNPKGRPEGGLGGGTCAFRSPRGQVPTWPFLVDAGKRPNRAPHGSPPRPS